MNPYVRDRISRKLDTLSDERLFQVLDYIEFLESRYAEKPAPNTNVFQRFTDGVGDTLRAGGLAAGTVSEAMGFLHKAMNTLSNVAETTRSVATDVVSRARTAADQIATPGSSENSAASGPTSGPTSASASGPTSGPTSGPHAAQSPVPPPAPPSADPPGSPPHGS